MHNYSVAFGNILTYSRLNKSFFNSKPSCKNEIWSMGVFIYFAISYFNRLVVYDLFTLSLKFRPWSVSIVISKEGGGEHYSLRKIYYSGSKSAILLES